MEDKNTVTKIKKCHFLVHSFFLLTIAMGPLCTWDLEKINQMANTEIKLQIRDNPLKQTAKIGITDLL